MILKVDSPGGEVMASDEISKAIANFQRTSRPTASRSICSMGSLAASGGYYISVAVPLDCGERADHHRQHRRHHGHGWNYRGLMDKVGLAPMTYKSGKFKDMLSGDAQHE